ncbi:hypothetical protein C1645_818722 [Glomus cerebriforme]|uniref:Uncharacterized protein n=1 Tax=Glomus cerebriforme TaxID=658196 RepID=A0A397T6L2_9GLOM|nr:hypothetical protein C1645_818722 [Glomus cerebriforme]
MPDFLKKNMDKMPIVFNLPSSIIIKQAGIKTVSILSTEYKHSNFMIVLTYIAENRINKKDLEKKVKGEENKNDSENNDEDNLNYNKTKSKESNKSKIKDNNKSELGKQIII